MAIINTGSNKMKYISIDLGTAHTLVYLSGIGVIYNEPSIVAYNIKENKIFAVGKEAAKLVGKGNKSIRVVRPMVDGVITDVRATQAQLNYIFTRLGLKKDLKNSVILMASPSVCTELEKKALVKIGHSFGAKHVYIEEEVKMSALGANIDINKPTGQFIVDMGGGTTDIAVITSGDLVVSDSVKVAGNFLTLEVLKYIRSQHGLEIGERTAEQIKTEIGSLVKYNDERKIKVYGRDVVSGLPREIEVSPSEIREVLKVPITKIIELIVKILEQTPPELAGDIFRNGITLCGGSAKIKNIDRYISETLSLPVRVADEPLLCVINGTKKFENDIFEKVGTSNKEVSY
ncbi:rod shape-determining protein [Spiroplasma endosymbiont of Anurida maritima]|uniref:rod shape-determining protein n=1 Tax=Spiroplasma endosymbiont of Anurida maritima TaxID=2967972 RepID=UPI0036D29A69